MSWPEPRDGPSWGEDVLPLGSESSGPGNTRNRAQDQGRATEVGRREHLVYLRLEVWKWRFRSVGIRVPAVPGTDFGPNGEAVTANHKHRSHLAAVYPPNPLYPSRFTESGGR